MTSTVRIILCCTFSAPRVPPTEPGFWRGGICEVLRLDSQPNDSLQDVPSKDPAHSEQLSTQFYNLYYQMFSFIMFVDAESSLTQSVVSIISNV